MIYESNGPKLNAVKIEVELWLIAWVRPESKALPLPTSLRVINVMLANALPAVHMVIESIED